MYTKNISTHENIKLCAYAKDQHRTLRGHPLEQLVEGRLLARVVEEEREVVPLDSELLLRVQARELELEVEAAVVALRPERVDFHIRGSLRRLAQLVELPRVPGAFALGMQRVEKLQVEALVELQRVPAVSELEMQRVEKLQRAPLVELPLAMPMVEKPLVQVQAEERAGTVA